MKTHLPNEDGVTPVHDVVDLAALVVDVEGEFFADDRVPGGAEKIIQSNLDFLSCRSHKQGCITPHFKKYRDEIYSLQILLSRTQAGPGRTV